VRIELRRVDSSPVSEAGVELHVQNTDVNGAPKLGPLKERRLLRGGVVEMVADPGTYIVVFYSGVIGPPVTPDANDPGIVGVQVRAGETSTVRIDLARAELTATRGQCIAGDESTCHDLGETVDPFALCAWRPADGGAERRFGCAGNNGGVAVLDLMPAAYDLRVEHRVYGGDVSRSEAVSIGQTVRFRCVVFTFVDEYGQAVAGYRDPTCERT
jgi:hypothetical protein